MIDFSEFSVEIRDKKFTNDDGIEFPGTAYITIKDQKQKKTVVQKYGFFETEEIYKKIDNGESLSFNQSYIHNFSLAKYRKSRGLPEDEQITLKDFSAHHSFLSSLDEINFSYALFPDGDACFNDTYFANGDVIFHSSKFGKGEKKFTYCIFKGSMIDFSNANFGQGNIDFKNSIFATGKKDFQYTEFGTGDVSFLNTEFNDGDLSFINCDFGEGNVNFKVARIGKGKVDFHFAKFGNGNITFERTEFGNGDVDFRTVEFANGKISFNRAVFGDGDVDFEACQLKSGRLNIKRAVMGKGYLSFVLAEFADSELFLDNTYFGDGQITFYNSQFKNISFKHCHIDHYLDLRLARCDFIDLSNTVARDIIDLKPYDFKVKIKTINMDGMRLLGRIYVDWDANKVKQLIKNQEETSELAKAEQFRTLKENFNTCGQYNEEDKAYVEFKRLEAKHLLYKGRIRGLWKYPVFFFRWLVFDQMGLYATNPLRVIASILTIYLLFSITYSSVPALTGNVIFSSYNFTEYINYIADCFYFSGVTFFTIGYGDFTPTGIFRGFAVIEGFIGVFMMSYFTVSFVHKILR